MGIFRKAKQQPSVGDLLANEYNDLAKTYANMLNQNFFVGSSPLPNNQMENSHSINWATNTTNYWGLYPYTPTSSMATTTGVSGDVSKDISDQIEQAKLSPHAALEGWRAWILELDHEEGPRIRSVAQHTIWPVRTEMRCDSLHGEAKPTLRNNAGIYAYRNEEAFRRGHHTTYRVYGPVAMWGDILHGEIGYRSEFAYPKKLYVTGLLNTPWWLKILSEEYGIPVEKAETPLGFDDDDYEPIIPNTTTYTFPSTATWTTPTWGTPTTITTISNRTDSSIG